MKEEKKTNMITENINENKEAGETEISLVHAEKSFGKTQVIRDLNLTIQKGERLILLGPSGCGKSTTLRMIAGLEELTGGDLYMGGIRSNDIPCGLRNVAMVFQNYALYPHMTVEKNITYGLKAGKLPQKEIDSRLEEVLEMLDLKPYRNRKPKELSGGQRQRVALARAVVKRAPYFLLDEPLSNLDAQLRMRARKELVKIHEKYHQTFIYVTHDQVEAMTVGQKIALLKDGELQMLDTPDRIYNQPANVFTAKFIGSPAMNIVKVLYTCGRIHLGYESLLLPDDWKKILDHQKETEFYLGIRPEHMQLSPSPISNGLKAVVKYEEDYGKEYGVYLDVEGQEMIAICTDFIPERGQTVYVRPTFKRFHFFHRNSEKNLGYPKDTENGTYHVFHKEPISSGKYVVDQKVEFAGREAI